MLDSEAKKQYKEKLVFDSKELPNRYAVPDKKWVGDITKWPSVE